MSLEKTELASTSITNGNDAVDLDQMINATNDLTNDLSLRTKKKTKKKKKKKSKANTIINETDTSSKSSGLDSIMVGIEEYLQIDGEANGEVDVQIIRDENKLDSSNDIANIIEVTDNSDDVKKVTMETQSKIGKEKQSAGLGSPGIKASARYGDLSKLREHVEKSKNNIAAKKKETNSHIDKDLDNLVVETIVKSNESNTKSSTRENGTEPDSVFEKLEEIKVADTDIDKESTNKDSTENKKQNGSYYESKNDSPKSPVIESKLSKIDTTDPVSDSPENVNKLKMAKETAELKNHEFTENTEYNLENGKRTMDVKSFTDTTAPKKAEVETVKKSLDADVSEELSPEAQEEENKLTKTDSIHIIEDNERMDKKDKFSKIESKKSAGEENSMEVEDECSSKISDVSEDKVIPKDDIQSHVENDNATNNGEQGENNSSNIANMPDTKDGVDSRTSSTNDEIEKSTTSSTSVSNDETDTKASSPDSKADHNIGITGNEDTEITKFIDVKKSDTPDHNNSVEAVDSDTTTNNIQSDEATKPCEKQSRKNLERKSSLIAVDISEPLDGNSKQSEENAKLLITPKLQGKLQTTLKKVEESGEYTHVTKSESNVNEGELEASASSPPPFISGSKSSNGQQGNPLEMSINEQKNPEDVPNSPVLTEKPLLDAKEDGETKQVSDSEVIKPLLGGSKSAVASDTMKAESDVIVEVDKLENSAETILETPAQTKKIADDVVDTSNDEQTVDSLEEEAKNVEELEALPVAHDVPKSTMDSKKKTEKEGDTIEEKGSDSEETEIAKIEEGDSNVATHMEPDTPATCEKQQEIPALNVELDVSNNDHQTIEKEKLQETVESNTHQTELEEVAIEPLDTTPSLDLGENAQEAGLDLSNPVESKDIQLPSENDKPITKKHTTMSDILAETDAFLKELDFVDDSEINALLESMETPGKKKETSTKQKKDSTKTIKTSDIKAQNMKEPVYIFTSLAGGGFHMIPRTNRLSTILQANRIEFTYRDLGTDDEARKVWKTFGKGRSLPSVVRGRDDIIGNWEEIEDLNEEYRVHAAIYESL